MLSYLIKTLSDRQFNAEYIYIRGVSHIPQIMVYFNKMASHIGTNVASVGV